MIRRILATMLILWALGFIWFAVSLPQPAPLTQTGAIAVPTGAGGRIARGLEVLRMGAADQMLVTGVDTDVRPGEFAAEFEVEEDLMECCVTLGFSALDTRGNAAETTEWMENTGFNSLRLVTSDWHMRRAAAELDDVLPGDIVVVQDAVVSEPSLWTLFLEYHKLLAAWLRLLA